MSGMPSMADDGDAMLWSTVALLEKLPTLSDDDYNDLWLASQAGGQSGSPGANRDGGRMEMGGMTMDRMAPVRPAVPGAPSANPTRQ